MKYLCDISVLLAAQWQNHPRHAAVQAWLADKQVAVCPLVQLGFVRISSDVSAPFKASAEDAHRLLKSFETEHKAGFVADDLSVLKLARVASRRTTDAYLAALAAAHGLVWATLDERSNTPGTEVIPRA